MSVGHPQLTTGIPVGKPAGMETRGSESLVNTGRHGSGFLSGCCEYLPQVLESLLFIYLNLIDYYITYFGYPFLFIKIFEIHNNIHGDTTKIK